MEPQDGGQGRTVCVWTVDKKSMGVMDASWRSKVKETCALTARKVVIATALNARIRED